MWKNCGSILGVYGGYWLRLSGFPSAKHFFHLVCVYHHKNLDLQCFLCYFSVFSVPFCFEPICLKYHVNFMLKLIAFLTLFLGGFHGSY